MYSCVSKNQQNSCWLFQGALMHVNKCIAASRQQLNMLLQGNLEDAATRTYIHSTIRKSTQLKSGLQSVCRPLYMY